MSHLENFAQIVDQAAFNCQEIAQIDSEGKLTLEEAYYIQKLSIGRRLARGERQVGFKMGFTSRAKMIQMGLSDVIWGRLTDAMQIEEGSAVNPARFIHPRVEPELAFLLKKDLPANVTNAQALSAVEAIAPALEIIDSRYKDFKFNLPEVIADNASSSGFVVGNWHSPTVDFSNLGLVMSIDGRPVHVGSTAALLGHPIRSLVAAARLAAGAGEPLKAGDIILAGGATPAEWIKAGQYIEVEMQGLGRAGFSLSAENQS